MSPPGVGPALAPPQHHVLTTRRWRPPVHGSNDNPSAAERLPVSRRCEGPLCRCRAACRVPPFSWSGNRKPGHHPLEDLPPCRMAGRAPSLPGCDQPAPHPSSMPWAWPTRPIRAIGGGSAGRTHGSNVSVPDGLHLLSPHAATQPVCPRRSAGRSDGEGSTATCEASGPFVNFSGLRPSRPRRHCPATVAAGGPPPCDRRLDPPPPAHAGGEHCATDSPGETQEKAASAVK